MLMSFVEGRNNLEPLFAQWSWNTMWSLPGPEEGCILVSVAEPSLCAAQGKWWWWGGMLLFLLWWTIVKCSPNLETPPFVSKAPLTQAVKLGAIALGGGLNGAIVVGRGSHGSHWGHRDAIVFLSREKGRKTVGASRHQWSQALTVFPGLRFLWGSPDLSVGQGQPRPGAPWSPLQSRPCARCVLWVDLVFLRIFGMLPALGLPVSLQGSAFSRQRS